MNLFKPSLSQFRQLSTSRVVNNMCWPKPDYGPMEVQRSVISNGIRVAAAKPLGAQIAACTIMFQAGSRNEKDDQLGVTHFLRVASSASGCAYTNYAKTRVLQQYGCSITCTSDRQSIAYTLRCPLPCFSELKCYLLDVAARCCYNQWELEDRKLLVRRDLVRMHPEQRVIDMVQQACWGGTLANSMFCEEDRIGSMSDNSLNCFASTFFKSDRCTVASVGVPFEETMKLAESIEYRREKPPPLCESCSYPRGGFELFDLGKGSDTWVALAVPGCGTCEISCLMKHCIVAATAGTGDMQYPLLPALPEGSPLIFLVTQIGQHEHDRNPMSPLGTMAGSDVYTQYRAFNISYLETGLFGILIKSKASTIYNAVVAASEFLANIGDISFKQIEIGKNRLKLALTLHDQDPVLVSEGLALQLANNVQIDSAKSSLCMVDMLCADEISCTAKVLSSKRCQLAMAAVGDIGAIPHDRELLCA